MRTGRTILAVVALAMTVSSSASAIVTVSLTQIGGTYNGVSLNPGETLILQMDYWITGGTFVSIIDVAVAFDSVGLAFNGGSETGPALWEFGAGSFAPLIQNTDIQVVAPGQIDGFEKATTFAGGVGTPGSCIFDTSPGGSCGTLGTLSFTILNPSSWFIDTGAIVQPTPFGTIIADGSGTDITASSSLGTFSIPEPTTASLLGLGLLGLTAASRRRRSRNG
jgi:hypothetical protein